jgi:RNA-directed DNA polymerase
VDIELTSSPEDRKIKFFGLRSFQDLADLLEVTPLFLNRILHRIPDEKYIIFKIPKKRKGEFRIISAPIRPLKIIQRKLKQVLEYIYEPRGSVYGFVPNRNIVDNAKAHKNGRKLKYVLNVDIENFFPSIHFGRVLGLFRKPPYNLPYKVALWLARICSTSYGLPQGAPTSPIIANMICNKMDSQLQRLAQKRKCTYTRYADDISFSTSLAHFPSTIASIQPNGQIQLGIELEHLIDINRFKINMNKIRLSTPVQRQEITGLIVNQFPNVPRKYIREVRAMLHDWQLNGYDAAQQKHVEAHRSKHRYPDKKAISFKQVVRGKIEYIGMVRGKHDPIYRRFMLQLVKLDPSIKFEDLTHMTEKTAKIFISYARLDEEKAREIYNRLEGSGYEPWLDQESIVGGEDWERAINKAIKDCDIFLAILSKNSVNRRGVLQKELKQALDKLSEKLDEDIFIIPLRIEECEIPERLEAIQWIDYFASNGWNKLTQAIQESLRRSTDRTTDS